MKYLKVVLAIVLVVVILGIGIFIFKFMQEDSKAWKAEVVIDYINVRKDHTKFSEQLGQIEKGEKYKIKKTYLKDKEFVWYKIEYKGSYGWISSDRETPYVKELNNPKKKKQGSYFIDYEAPIIRYFENEYVVDDLNSIKYDHLEIEDDSKYTIKHNVYYEEHPIDTDIPQYWIEYIVTDKFGNVGKKVQKIVFRHEPAREEVKDFSELKN